MSNPENPNTFNAFLTPEDYHYLYRITAGPTPLRKNCGTLCDSVCCQPGPRNDLGIYLFPGEEVMFTRRENWLNWEAQDPAEQLFPASWPNPVYFVRCNGPCPREARPLACRFFPLAPHLQQDGRLLLIYETMDLPYQCPLIATGQPLQKNFIQTVNTAWKLMVKDQRIRDFVEEESRDREARGVPLQIPPVI